MTFENYKIALLLSVIAIAGTSSVVMVDAMEPKKGTTLFLDDIEKAPDTLTNEKRELIRSHIDSLAVLQTEGINSGELPIVGVGTDFKNEAVKVRILDSALNDKTAQIYEEKIRNVIGTEIDITIIPGQLGVFTGCIQNGECEPLQAGTRIAVENTTGYAACSMGIKAAYDSKTGFVTAGHCNYVGQEETGEDVGNPNILTANVLGTVHDNAFVDDGWCDCMFIDATETISDKIFNGTDVSGELFPVVNDDVEWSGIASQGSSSINDTYESFSATWNGETVTIQGSVRIDDEFSMGDSGGIVYEEVTSGTPKFAGIIMGKSGGDGYYIPYYRITNAFSGLTFTYT